MRTIICRRQPVVAVLVGAVAVGEVVVGVGGVDADDTFDQLKVVNLVSTNGFVLHICTMVQTCTVPDLSGAVVICTTSTNLYCY